MVHLAVHPLPRKFRRQDAALAVFADCTNDQFTLKNMHAKLGTTVIKCLCIADTHRFARRFAVGLRPDCRTLAGNLRFCMYIILPDLFNTLCQHNVHPLCVLPVRHNALDDAKIARTGVVVNAVLQIAANTKDSFAAVRLCLITKSRFACRAKSLAIRWRSVV